MAEENVEPLLLFVIDKVKQEIEDMAYDKLRSVLSDFSLQGYDLQNKLDEHKSYIKMKAHEIIKQRLEEHKILLTEEEFLCICGKYQRDMKKNERHPLINVETLATSLKHGDVRGKRSSSSTEDQSPRDQDKRTTEDIMTSTTGFIAGSTKATATSRSSLDSIESTGSYSTRKTKGLSTDVSESISSSIIKNVSSTSANIRMNAESQGTISTTEELEAMDFKDHEDYMSAIQQEISSKHKDSELYAKKITSPEKLGSKTGKIFKKKGYQQDAEFDNFLEHKKGAEADTFLKATEDAEYDKLAKIKEYQEKKKHYEGKSDVADEELLDDEELSLARSKETLEDKEYIDTEKYKESPGGYGTNAEVGIDYEQRIKDKYKYDKIILHGEDFIDELESNNYLWITKFINELIEQQYSNVTADLLAENIKSISDTNLISKGDSSTSVISLLTSTSESTISSDDLEYLQKSFGSILELALADVTLKMPSSPIAYIAQYLQIYHVDNLFDVSKRNALANIEKDQKTVEENKERFLAHKKKLNLLGEEISKKLLNSKLEYEFSIKGKVAQKRGRRLRKDIVSTCDILLEKTPLYNLGKKLRRLYTFNNVFDYAKAIIRPLERELVISKYNAALEVYNKIVEFLNPILPELKMAHFEGDSCLNIIFNKPGHVFTSTTNPFEEPAAKNFRGKYRNRSNIYPCLDKDNKQHNYACNVGHIRHNENDLMYNKERMQNIFAVNNKPLKVINHVTKAEACAMCAEVPNIIKFLFDEQKNEQNCLIYFVTEEYIATSLHSMYNEHYKYMLAVKQQDEEILENVLKLVEKALDFEYPEDLVIAYEEMKSYISELILRQRSALKMYKHEDEERAVKELRKQLIILSSAALLGPSELPCTCKRDAEMDKSSEDSWSDDEDGMLDTQEQKRLYDIMHKIAEMIGRIHINQQGVNTIEHILESFITRASRKHPYLSRRAHFDWNHLINTIVDLYSEKQEQFIRNRNEGCNVDPCLCKYVMQVSGLFVATHARMVKNFEEFRKNERDELEHEIMRMFASLVHDLTVDKIKKQNLCASNF